jgi:hypothetical protein
MSIGQFPGMGFQNPKEVVATEVIIVGDEGALYVYDPTQGENNLTASITEASSDGQGNVPIPGIASYAVAGTEAFAGVLNNASLQFYLSLNSEQGPWSEQVVLSLISNGSDNGFYFLLSSPVTGATVGVAIVYPSGDTTGATDASNIQTALSDQGYVFLLPGEYYTNVEIEVATDQAVLCGSGKNASIIHCLSNTAHGIYSDNVSNVVIQHLKLDGPGDAATVYDGIHIDTSTGNNAANCDLNNLIIQNFGEYGVYTNAAIITSVRNVEVSDVAEDSFFILDGTSVRLDTCYSHNQSGTGYVINGVQYGSLANCACDFGLLGYEINNCNNIKLDACGAEGQAGTGVVGGFKITGGSVGISLDSCLVRGNDNIAYWITDNSLNCTLNACQEIAPNTGAAASFQVDPGSTAIVTAPTYVTAPAVWQYVGAAGQPAFGTGWSNVGGVNANLAFRLAGPSCVQIKGYVNNSVAANAAPVFTLPANYLPNSQQLFTTTENPNTAPNLVTFIISTAGAVNRTVAAGAGIYLIDFELDLEI